MMPTDRALPTLRSDTFLLYAARGVRGFGDGFALIILPAYLTAIGYDPVAIGIVATASLLGSAVLTLAGGYLGTRDDPRPLMLGGALPMVFTGFGFSEFQHIRVIIILGVVRTGEPSSGDNGI